MYFVYANAPKESVVNATARRDFLFVTAGAGIFLSETAARAASAQKALSPRKGGHETQVAPAEDLMREHGVLNRVLLLYEEGVRRLDEHHPLPIETIASAAGIVRRFIEQYHEKLEEDHLFPRFEQAGKLVDLVSTLRGQHQAGRRLTERILAQANMTGVESASGRQKLIEAIGLFIRMYRPHEAREDTVLFPAIRTIVPSRELDALGEQFEDKEQELFGKEGFEGIVSQVAKLEQTLGIYSLEQFTPGPGTPSGIP
jgi:hemerythrin-like domain-containing protein